MGREPAATPLFTPEEAFALLGNETRLRVLQVLWEAHEPYGPPAPIPFSGLYDRVGHDDTANFNYHLQQLIDRFIRRTDEGYVLMEAGLAVVRAVIAGTVTERPDIQPSPTDIACSQCGAPIVVAYDNQRTAARCTECSGLFGRARSPAFDETLFHLPFPPGGWEGRTPEEVFHATVEYNFHQIASYRAGICPYCAGMVEESIDVCEAHEPGDSGLCPACERSHLVEVRETCRRCKASEWGPLSIAILTHPFITAFYHDHGIEHRFASWESFRRGATIETEVVETEPLHIRVTVPCADELLRLVVDEELSVLSAEREPAATGG